VHEHEHASGTRGWSAPLRLDDAADTHERLHAEPRLVFLGDDEVAVAWTDLSRRRPDTDARGRRWRLAAAPAEALGAAVVLDGPDDGFASGRSPVPVAAGAQPALPWQELGAARRAELRLATEAGPVGLLSDGPAAARWPDAVGLADGRTVVVAWVDGRTEPAAVRVATWRP
jgi:hypothetical protein